MSYVLQAIIGLQECFQGVTSDRLASIQMNCGLRMVPLTREVCEHYGIGHLPLTDDGVQTFPEALATVCCELSRNGLVAYLEAEFFGGTGTQAHVLFRDGHMLGIPVIAEDAINRALKAFNVPVGASHDEFAAVGLGRCRNTEDWLRVSG
jgi:hypothetical protein